MVLDRVQPLALGWPGAHVVTAAVGMGEERAVLIGPLVWLRYAVWS